MIFMPRKLLCYRCFEKFSPHEVCFRCDNIREPDKTGGCPLEQDSKMKEMLPHAFPLRGFGRVLSSFFVAPKKCRCDNPQCRYISKTRICPNCHHPLLYEQGEIDEHIIAIIGGPRAGKSHCFTVLIGHCLKGYIGKSFNTYLAPADDETDTLFRREYSDRLFKKKQVLPSTPPEARADLRLIYRLNFRRKHPLTRKVRNKPITLAFYDIAGDLLSSRPTITSATRYLWHSAGIIYLVNPLHIPELLPLIKEGPKEEDAPGVTPDTILSNVVAEFRKNKELKPGEQIKVPLAVCLSQSDRLQNLSLDSRLFRPHRHNGAFDTDDFKVINAEVQDKLQEWGGIANNMHAIADADFRTKGFFSVSALGASPDEDGRIERINPIRLEDPFLWLLSEIGLIKKMN
jgi:hypothetical protein